MIFTDDEANRYLYVIRMERARRDLQRMAGCIEMSISYPGQVRWISDGPEHVNCRCALIDWHLTD